MKHCKIFNSKYYHKSEKVKLVVLMVPNGSPKNWWIGMWHKFVVIPVICKSWNRQNSNSSYHHLGLNNPQISNRGRCSIRNINQQLTICQQMLKIWCIHLSLICNVMKKIDAFMVYFLSFNLANFNWPGE